jgi:ABC-type lipoprotein release transport system permease subunit
MGPLVRGLLSNISPFDPVTLAGVALLCLVAALAASIGPARRAIRTDPVVALR